MDSDNVAKGTNILRRSNSKHLPSLVIICSIKVYPKTRKMNIINRVIIKKTTAG